MGATGCRSCEPGSRGARECVHRGDKLQPRSHMVSESKTRHAKTPPCASPETHARPGDDMGALRRSPSSGNLLAATRQPVGIIAARRALAPSALPSLGDLLNSGHGGGGAIGFGGSRLQPRPSVVRQAHRGVPLSSRRYRSARGTGVRCVSTGAPQAKRKRPQGMLLGSKGTGCAPQTARPSEEPTCPRAATPSCRAQHCP